MDPEKQQIPAAPTPESAPPPPPPRSDEQIEADLGSFDFDTGEAPAGGPAEPREPSEGEGSTGPAGVVEQERPTEADDDEREVTMRDNRRLKISELKRGYLPEYPAHLRNLAEREQNFARVTAGFNQTQAYAARYLQGAIEYLQSKMPMKPDPRLIHSDLLEYNRQNALYEIENGKLQEMRNTRNVLVNQFQAAQRREFAERFRNEQLRTMHHLPDLKDPIKDAKWKQSARQLGAELGYSPQELSQMYDHRLMRLIDWAVKGKQYDAAFQRAKAKKAREAQEAPAMQAPQRRRTSAEVQAASFNQRMTALKKNPNSTKLQDELLGSFD